VNAPSRPPRSAKMEQWILLAQLILALIQKRKRYPLTCAALWSALQLVYSNIPGDGMEGYLVITHEQVHRFLDAGWDYTEPRLRLLRQVNGFPFTRRGAMQLVELRRRMDNVHDGSFDQVSTVIYEDPVYPILQHVGQAFRNQVTGRGPFVMQTLMDVPTRLDRICDFGCGSGLLLGDVLERVPEAHGTGMDISCRVLRHASQVLSARGLDDRAGLVRADIRRIPVNNGKFDLVLAMEVLEHLPDPASGLRELTRILAPDGWLVTSIPVEDRAPVHLFVFDSIEQVRQMHLSAGLQIERQLSVEVAPGVPNVLSAARRT
jgi:2-polyprenyl-3-methyl-5-hydroxy-6-metoxy-1,4-benzoquinol methylase